MRGQIVAEAGAVRRPPSPVVVTVFRNSDGSVCCASRVKGFPAGHERMSREEYQRRREGGPARIWEEAGRGCVGCDRPCLKAGRA